MDPRLKKSRSWRKNRLPGGMNPRKRCSVKMTTSSFAGEGTNSSPGARALTLDGRRPASRCTFSCSTVTVDPPQSAEIDLLDDEDLAAAAAVAAMSTVLLDEEALALEAVLVRLGAMAYVRSELRAGKKMSGRKKKIGGERAREGFWTPPLAIYKRVKTLESYDVVPR